MVPSTGYFYGAGGAVVMKVRRGGAPRVDVPWSIAWPIVELTVDVNVIVTLLSIVVAFNREWRFRTFVGMVATTTTCMSFVMKVGV